MMQKPYCLLVICLFCVISSSNFLSADDPIYNLQTEAIKKGKAEFGHWGWKPHQYMLWGSHSNRLIPVYTFGAKGTAKGVNLTHYTNSNSPYRSEKGIRKFYGRVPKGTLNPNANYLDQTNIYDIQLAALRGGKKHIFLVVFDGMDWQTTQAAALWKTKKLSYRSGRGTGLHFQDYKAGGNTQFGAMVTSPYADKYPVDIDKQSVSQKPGTILGGYAWKIAGEFPWSKPTEGEYLIGKSTVASMKNAYTDSASSATSMTSGFKTYNSSINISPDGTQLVTIAHLAQKKGWKVGAVTSVPISHATPGASYAHNVSRHDYQDISRDLLGLPSVSHPKKPLHGLDVLIGCGFSVTRNLDKGQGKNFVPGNAFLAKKDLLTIDSRAGGKYVVAIRTEGQSGEELLKVKADDAIASNKRLFGFFGTKNKHLPFQTADGKYNPSVGRRKKVETYSKADIQENPTLENFTEQAIRVLSQKDSSFWLMVEAGDVDWANHDNNIDNSIGAVYSGDKAVQTITKWVEKNSNWKDSLLIVTADHGHYFVLEHPEQLLEKP
ncbi:Alkaline phosphatase [hydrothermal vent metagenome]|uniref:Alkaline phosphatase n=1 Tax=hydrothermal vent metagenome TaxID=652676 RepID=A0A3B1DZW4_9ZZZZ